ncbi:peptide-methionine (S)-S-oxide reductase MsrA [Methylobacterium haplocladii]|uniref:Peptide methionine sulfoxide reductase MsrA n=1 Tax=Methylobacterium haplocladii TaxID=1176176 RepID=A0A512IR84_9HYPH|nr:peptide-methionine (S)-S-oxide reductase MsrA [Methylobacterium haplocladii]GEP00220.1 peptide methionine sulfoxide reductase MsrA [Methylobacterium haplocladii]GJD84271.1 Peptide methionine sulfoxide reductase MsrA [Methylobacterium haplocladii]GLS57934.1 peptide methionine sulfoxide reductase MsrA [Methylobacterium haplocladii]
MTLSKYLKSTAVAWPLALGGTVGLGLIASLSLPQGIAFAEEAGQRVPESTAKSTETPGKLRTATLAGGCFWGVQGVFQHVKGVTQAVSGYAGGTRETANYGAVGRGRTGHAEAVRITYDPAVIRYDELLQIYFSVALDPTEVNRQGPDTGTQYRTAIFPSDAEQAKVAKDYIAQLDAAKVYRRPIATKIEPGAAFYPAEDYHQDYMALNPDAGYIVANDAPKLQDLKRLFPERANTDPVLVGKPKA